MDAMIMMWVWLAVIAIAAFVEAFTLQMVSVWFVPGGLVGLILYFCGVGYEWQIVAAVLVSLVLLFCLRGFCLKFLFKNKVDDKTNSDSLIGKILPLKGAILADQAGAVKVGDVIWTAVTEDETAIGEGEKVEITAIKGNKLVVKLAATAAQNDTPVAETKKDTKGKTEAENSEEIAEKEADAEPEVETKKAAKEAEPVEADEAKGKTEKKTTKSSKKNAKAK